MKTHGIHSLKVLGHRFHLESKSDEKPSPLVFSTSLTHITELRGKTRHPPTKSSAHDGVGASMFPSRLCRWSKRWETRRRRAACWTTSSQWWWLIAPRRSNSTHSARNRSIADSLSNSPDRIIFTDATSPLSRTVCPFIAPPISVRQHEHEKGPPRRNMLATTIGDSSLSSADGVIAQSNIRRVRESKLSGCSGVTAAMNYSLDTGIGPPVTYP